MCISTGLLAQGEGSVCLCELCKSGRTGPVCH